MNALVLSGFNAPAVTIDPKVVGQRDYLVRDAKCIVAVTCDLELELAACTLQDIKGLLKRAEESRKEIKEPVLLLGRAVDATAKEFAAALEAEVARIGRLVADYTEKQRRAAAEAERKRQEELSRIEADRVAAEQAAQKKAAEEANNAKSPEEAETVAARVQETREAIAQDAAKRTADILLAPAPAAPKIKGVSVAKSWRFSVEDVEALYRARPDLVELVPSVRRINEAIKGGQQIQGLRVWEQTKVGVRA